MKKFFAFFFSFLILHAVDPAGETTDAVITDGEPNDGKGPELSVEDQVAAEFGFDAEDSNAEVAKDTTDVVDDANPNKEAPAPADGEVALTDEEKAAKEATDAKSADEAKAITEDDLKPLDSKNKDTNARFEKITAGYKEQVAANEKLSNELTAYKGSIESLRELGFTDEAAASDLVEFSAFRHVLATGDVPKFQEIIANQVKQFEAMHGKKVTIAASAIDDYEDLKAAVDNLEMTDEHATEIARSRKLTERTNRERETRQVNNQTAEQHQAAINEATAQVSQMQQNWSRTDPDYPKVIAELEPLMTDIATKFPASQWPSIIDMQYKSLKKALVLSGNQQQTPSPLRGNASISGKAVPNSVEDAVLAEMGFDIEA